LLIGRVLGAEPGKATLTVARIDGEQVVLDYDRLIVALGSVSRTLPIPGLAEHAVGLKSLSDATALRNQVLRCLDIAESLEDPEERRAYLGFVGVGAGYAGVEGLAELQDFASRVVELYPRCRAQGMRWVLVEAQKRIMGEVPKGLSRFAQRELEGRGIEVLTETMLHEVTAGGVRLSNGDEVAARTVVWTAGVKPAPAVAGLGLPLDGGGRLVVDDKMRVKGHEGVWAIGDCAAVPDPAHRGRPCPPTAQHALRQGRTVARNVAATLGNGRERRFRWRSLGVVAELGHNQAVAITVGIRWRGLPAWFIARTYHLMLVPGVRRRLRLLVDWNVALLFGRDASATGRLGSPTPLEDGEQARAAYPDNETPGIDMAKAD
jgi:NADH dehydrogenase